MIKMNEDYVTYEEKLEMVDMHNKYLHDLDNSLKDEKYIEACSLCYSIFEQRVKRLMIKYLNGCCKEKKKKGPEAGISCRLSCISYLININYNNMGVMDSKVFNKISKWCKKRNSLTHDLVKLNRYKKYEKEYKELALDGKPLVDKIYIECEKYRKIWKKKGKNNKKFINEKCKCETRCLYEKADNFK